MRRDAYALIAGWLAGITRTVIGDRAGPGYDERRQRLAELTSGIEGEVRFLNVEWPDSREEWLKTMGGEPAPDDVDGEELVQPLLTLVELLLDEYEELLERERSMPAARTDAATSARIARADALAARVRSLRSAGRSIAEIAAETNRTERTVLRLKGRPPD